MSAEIIVGADGKKRRSSLVLLFAAGDAKH